MVKMGFKRPFDEEFQEFPLRHPKQVDCGNKLTLFTEIYSCYEPTKKADIPGEGEGNFCKVQSGGGLSHDNRNVISNLVDKEYVGPGVAVCSISSEYFGLYYPRRSVVPFEDTYSSLLDSSPRRRVSIGPNHQAEVPVWDPQAVGKYYSGSDGVVNADGGKLMGACILPMPDPELSAHSDVAGVNAGDGRKDCLCLDQGSVRCVRQHVRKAREWVRETLGHEKFVQLGLGEEVSQKWTEEEEHAFHEVVYSNPESHGKNFWEHLSMVFPSQTKKEIASYFFNVFMLRRRAFQNRSHFLDIDSDDDDDDWQGANGSPFGVAQDDEDYAIESLVAEDDFPDGNGDVENGGGNSTEKDGGRSLLSNAQIGTSLEGFGSEFVVHHVSKILGGDGEKFDAQNVSRVGFEYQAKPVDSFGSANTRAAVQQERC
ncbi:AT-rich interactive domain-containing protein 2 [Camellia lanceoleosa]|uniref:AT-rich interactive domain-containing protein 2 n=1 Tax=Camellia lanceoleosa TaxID=1840588 RepID=A0ACC0G6M7_9ERIC|nr:AT-rich interactive domain-containing protein 2 [Camellia lanceoleosa]